MKRLLALAFLLSISQTLLSQKDTSIKKGKDTVRKKIDTPRLKTDNKATVADTSGGGIDTTRKTDSAAIALADSLKQDSIRRASVQKPVVIEKDTTTYAAIMYHPFLPYNKPYVSQISKDRGFLSDDGIFYLLLGVFMLVGFIKIVFPKYFQNLFSLFFQTSFRQKQTRDQLLQDNLASLLMNVLFIIGGSIFIALIVQRQGWIKLDFWWLLLYCGAILGGTYLIKYIFLLFSGWVFNVKEATDTYLFVVFFVNKIVGVVLLPFLLMLAFSALPLVQITITVAAFILGAMLLYRYVVSMGTIRSSLKVNALHFFLYLCAVEVLPLLLLYKVLFNLIRHYP